MEPGDKKGKTRGSSFPSPNPSCAKNDGFQVALWLCAGCWLLEDDLRIRVAQGLFVEILQPVNTERARA